MPTETALSLEHARKSSVMINAEIVPPIQMNPSKCTSGALKNVAGLGVFAGVGNK